MQDFQHKNVKLEFAYVDGEILSQNKFSETKVSSSGGGGNVGPNGGRVSAPKITSRTVTHHEFWVRKADGSEVSVHLQDNDIPLREGQNITLVLAKIKGNMDGFWTILVNHNAARHWFIKDSLGLINALAIQARPKWLNLFKYLLLAYIVFGGVYLAINVDTYGIEEFILGFLINLVFHVVIYYVCKIFLKNRLKVALSKHLTKIAQLAHKRP